MNKAQKILVLGILIIIISIPFAASAQNYNLLAPLPGGDAKVPVSDAFVTYARQAFWAILSGAAILAVVMIVIGGVQYVGSAGNESIIKDAKDRIWNALLGLLLALAAWLILYTINPNLVSLQLDVPEIGEARSTDTGSDGTTDSGSSGNQDRGSGENLDTTSKPTKDTPATPAPPPLIPECNDKKDNDGDGKTDLADDDCFSLTDNSESSSSSARVCPEATGRDAGCICSSDQQCTSKACTNNACEPPTCDRCAECSGFFCSKNKCEALGNCVHRPTERIPCQPNPAICRPTT